jgi:hypothetical protein
MSALIRMFAYGLICLSSGVCSLVRIHLAAVGHLRQRTLLQDPLVGGLPPPPTKKLQTPWFGGCPVLGTFHHKPPKTPWLGGCRPLQAHWLGGCPCKRCQREKGGPDLGLRFVAAVGHLSPQNPQDALVGGLPPPSKPVGWGAAPQGVPKGGPDLGYFPICVANHKLLRLRHDFIGAAVSGLDFVDFVNFP